LNNKIRPLFVQDFAKMISVVAKQGSKEKIIEVCGPDVMSFYDFVKKYADAKKKKLYGIPLVLFKPIFWIVCRLKLLGFNMDQYRFLKLDNIGKKHVLINTKYEIWLKNITTTK